MTAHNGYAMIACHYGTFCFWEYRSISNFHSLQISELIASKTCSSPVILSEVKDLLHLKRRFFAAFY